VNTDDRLRAGDQVKIVSDQITRKYGIGCGNPYGSPQDRVVWPGEVGVVTRTPYTAHNGEPMAAWHVVFPRGRRVALTVPEGQGYADATEARFLLASDADPFRRVPARRAPRGGPGRSPAQGCPSGAAGQPTGQPGPEGC
jgi:hypothetical protein